MPIFTPSRRWQPAYYPFKERSFSERIEETLERTLKGLLWGCRMCGNCLLQETAFICPMACPKGLRNGPCGGSTPEHCCVDESRPCIWYEIYHRAEKMGRLEKLLEVLPPLDWDKTGTSALRDVANKVGGYGLTHTISIVIQSSPDERKDKWDHFFKDIRQPEWWSEDSHPHPAPLHEPVSRLEEKLASGEFVLTSEFVPPLSDQPSILDQELIKLKNTVDALNITDSASAIPRVSPIACATRAIELGIEPVLQMAARDRTRLSFQSDLMGASVLGVRNILIITGDHPNKGLQPYSKMDIWDYDSIQGIWMARKLRDESTFLDGRKVIEPPSYFISAAASPYASTPKYQAIRVEKKVNAGAQFLQTNLIFDLPRFEEYLEALDKRSLLDRVYLIAGVTQIKSISMGRNLQQLPGVIVPEWIFERLSKSKDIKEESHQLTLEIIEKIKSLPGVRGIHFMANGNINHLKRLITESDLKI